MNFRNELPHDGRKTKDLNLRKLRKYSEKPKANGRESLLSSLPSTNKPSVIAKKNGEIDVKTFWNFPFWLDFFFFLSFNFFWIAYKQFFPCNSSQSYLNLNAFFLFDDFINSLNFVTKI